jgi:F0F1-type ATP synthase delta subunit
MEVLILSDFFSTKAQSNDFSERLSTVETVLYEVDFDLETQLEEQLGVRKKDRFMSLLRENNISLESKQEISKFFRKINETIKNLPLLELTIGIEPNENILKSISHWFVLNTKRQVLFEVNVDPDMIAGALIEFQGKRLNASIKPEFSEICKTNLASSS